MRSMVRVLVVILSFLAFQPAFAADPPPASPMVELDKSNKARSKYISLHKRLDQVRAQFEKGDGKRMLSTLKSATRDLAAAQKKDDGLDLSAEEAEIAAYSGIAEGLVEAAAAAKLRDKAFKSLDREISKLEKMVKQAERSKPRPEQFETSLEKAETLLADALSADPSADAASRRAALDTMTERYEAAQVTFLHAGAFKDITKRMTALGKAIDKLEKPVKRLNTNIERAVEAGEDFWPERATEDYDALTEAFAEARAEHAGIDMSGPEASLADIDARIAEIKPAYIQTGLDLYFEDKVGEITEQTEFLGQSYNNGSSYLAQELPQEIKDVRSLASVLEASARAYPDADLSAHEAQYAAASAEFDAMIAKHETRRNLFEYLQDSAEVLQVLGTENNFDLPYMHKDVFESGIEDFDIATFRERLGQTSGNAGRSRDGGAPQYYALMESRMKGNDYINGVKDLLKRTNSDSLDLNERTDNAKSAVRLALLGQKFYPDDSRYDALVDETRGRETAMQDEASARYASASTGPFHLEHMDSIVFTTAPLEIGNEDAALVSDSFDAGTPIYGTAYLSLPISTLSNERKEREKVRLDAQIDGRSCRDYGVGYVKGIGKDGLDATVVQFVLLPKLDGYAYEDRNDSHINFAKCQQDNATLGEQDVRVELGLIDPTSTNRDELDGMFKLAYDDGAADRVKPIVAALHEMRIDAVRMPKPVMSDPELEAVMIETVKLNADGEPLRAVLNNKTWNVEKNELDIPVRQELWGRVAIKKPDGTCIFYSTIIAKEYVGGTYNPPRPWQLIGQAVPIRCENVGE